MEPVDPVEDDPEPVEVLDVPPEVEPDEEDAPSLLVEPPDACAAAGVLLDRAPEVDPARESVR